MTSPPEKVTVECPKCGYRFEEWFRASVNANLDPELAAEGSSATCPKCGNVADFATLIVEFEDDR